MNLLCRLGLHKWRPWQPPELGQYQAMGIRLTRSRRCRRCGGSNVVGTL